MFRCWCNKTSVRKGLRVSGLPLVDTLDCVDCPTRDYSKLVCTAEPSHWGQEKLLVSEIKFLTPFYGQSYYVVYAGAAPGTHIPILARMFSTMLFVLVDPAQSMIRSNEYPNVEVMNAYMTDELARVLADICGDSILFVSDVRIGSVGGGAVEADEDQQRRIHRDMLSQQGWLRIMNPVRSMLKFRLPWSLGAVTEYVGGEICFPVYGKRLTHETRLVVPRGASQKRYDNVLYERQLAYYNQVMRPAAYYTFGRLGCYDCSSFRLIIRDFLKASGRDCSDGELLSLECLKIELELRLLAERWSRRRPRPAAAHGLLGLAVPQFTKQHA